MKRRSAIFTLTIAGACAFFSAQACGPEFEPDVFVRTLQPDKPGEFAAGKLGVLLPTYPRMDLTVAYRYLAGGTLDSEEQAAYTPTYSTFDREWEDQWDANIKARHDDVQRMDSWSKLRAQFIATVPLVEPQKTGATPLPGGYVEQVSYDNCNADAFTTAAATLKARVAAWSASSPDLADWLRAQDTVFNNCTHTPLALPADAPASGSALLKADRAYQQAAARFYAADFVNAREGFQAIAQDANSPWHSIAPYLAARCLVRQAFHARPGDYGEMATFDPALMKQAQAVLEQLVKQNAAGAPAHAIRNELDLVMLRTDPLARMRELAVALAGPQKDAQYEQHLTDLTWILNVTLDSLPVRRDFSNQNQAQGTPDSTFKDLSELRATAPLVDWLITFQSGVPAAKDHAIAQWKSTHQQQWLVAAISQATGEDAAAAQLIAAAADVKPNAPAWELINYHRIRLMIESGHAADARAQLALVMPQIRAGGRASSLNLFIGLNANAARNLEEFLTYAPRKTIEAESESQSSLGECLDVMKDPKRVYDCTKSVSPVQFSADAARFFNRQAPLSTLVEATQSTALPAQLRTSVVMAGWVRAVLLKDNDAARKLAPLLPEKLQQQAAGSDFHAIMTILRNPGLRPYLDPGVQRSYSYDFVESYADNWWCGDWTKSWDMGDSQPQPVDAAAFLSPAQRKQSDAELHTLAAQSGAAVYLGGLVMQYATAHPDDPDVPEALYLLLRTIRYGCARAADPGLTNPDPETKRVSELRVAASRLLRQRYATNAWTKKAGPYAG